MTTLRDELNQQPQALHDLASYYHSDPGRLDLPVSPGSSRLLVLSGMGASYHAACIGALYFNSLGIPAVSIEASDLANYASALCADYTCLIYISQSGSSGEITPIVEKISGDTQLVGITNTPDSLLGQRALRVLPLMAGDELLIASKTYVNSLALLWLMARKAAGPDMDAAFQVIVDIADRAGQIIAGSDETSGRLISFYQPGEPLLFTGHGPHAVTARQASMASSEWAKIPSMHSGIGAFRHGFIETVRPGYGVIVFSSPGVTSDSSLNLASELEGMGARVLRIEQGRLLSAGTPSSTATTSEFLCPILDILPIQLFADALARALDIPFGFRYISKVVRQL
jgi:glutamine---fructose-6-phosphate transaminase (isomerizing)